MQIKSKQVQSKIITANAGSGKTYQVVERIKDILQKGHAPSSVLCITFTNSGQKEMEKRLHENCKEFIISEKPKVVTFHSLCLEIVSMFTHELSMPFEFEIMEKIPEEFIQEITNQVLFTDTAQEYIKKYKILYNNFKKICELLIYQYLKLLDLETRIQFLNEAFSCDGQNNTTEEIIQIQTRILQEIPLSLFQSLSGTKITQHLPKIIEIHNKHHNPSKTKNLNKETTSTDFEEYCKIIKTLTHKKNGFTEYKEKIEENNAKINDILTFERSIIINKLAQIITQITEKHKQNTKKYTFDDIIHKALTVLKKPELKDFALFKFGNFKHIIVDEAQDTNQDQWKIIHYFTEEIRGTGMQEGSLFIVGDEKQTIYSFQGAEENIMHGIYIKYKSFLTKEYLPISYRTTQPVLDVINSMAGIFNINNNSHHISSFKNDAGSFHVIASNNKSTKENLIDENQIIAEKTAEIIKSLFVQKLQHEKPKYHGKQIEPKDIAILVKKRPNQEVINTIKTIFYAHKIPVSFNEKINAKKYYAILDFITLLKLCICSDDKTSLYGILKSPIFKINEAEFEKLFTKESTTDDIYKQYPHTLEAIQKHRLTLMNQGISMFFYTLYNKYHGNYSQTEQKILAAFIQHSYKANQYNFIEFIQNFESSEAIFYNKEQEPNTITFTTAHSSKGLEFPIVLYLDLQTKEHSEKDSIFFYKGIPIFKPSKENQGMVIQKILEERKQENKQEDSRLYYVAISRAAEQFYYICNASQTEKENSLYYFLKKGMETLGAEISSDNNFTYICYSKTKEITTESSIHTQPAEHFIQYTPQITQKKEVQTKETIYGTFIHKLFENIEKKEFLQEELYLEFLNEEINFHNILEKVQNFNQKINNQLQPQKILREYEFIYQNKIIRLDAIYFQTDYISIIDYKTQKQGITDEIKTQLLEYQKAVQEVFKQHTKCFIAWFNEEILELI
jgi:ATP-dependent helicase/nuclease subunit A